MSIITTIFAQEISSLFNAKISKENLEKLHDGKTIILCSKVVLNAKDKVAIKPSTKGKVVSQKDYDETVIKKMEEFREMNRGRAGGPPMMGR